MKPIANHRTGPASPRTVRNAWASGALLPPEHMLLVPVLTTSNRKQPLLVDIMEHDPLFHFDRRPEKKWSWWLKMKSAETYAAKFKEEGHEHFLYLDSDDGFLWRSFTNEDCEEFLDGADIRFQTGPKGLCAGFYIARTDTFAYFADVHRNLRDMKSPKASRPGDWVYDDQETWKSMRAMMPERIGVQEKTEAVTGRLLGKKIKAMEERRKPAGLGDSVAAVLQKLGVKTCGGCAKRQERLNKLFPYKT